MRNGNSDIQNAHLKKYNNTIIKTCCELHRDEKAYKNFKHVPDYGGKEKNDGAQSTTKNM